MSNINSIINLKIQFIIDFTLIFFFFYYSFYKKIIFWNTFAYNKGRYFILIKRFVFFFCFILMQRFLFYYATNHQVIASLYFYFSIFVGFIAFFYSFIMRLSLLWPYSFLNNGQVYLYFVTLHAIYMIFFFCNDNLDTYSLYLIFDYFFSFPWSFPDIW